MNVTTLFAIDFPKEKERWTTLDLDGFVIVSNAPELETMRVAENLQQMRAAMVKISRLRVDAPIQTKIYVLHHESFVPYPELLLGKNARQVAGFFFNHPDGNYIMVDAKAMDQSTRIIDHELTHCFVRNTSPSVPLWFDEGLAEFYSTFTSSGSKVRIGMPIAEHLNWLENFKLLPLPQLFAVTTTSPDYNEGVRQGRFYAQSWLLVHYLMVGAPERKGQLDRFVSELEGGKAIDPAFREAFGAEYAVLEKELEVYLHRVVHSGVEYALDELQVSAPGKPQTMPKGEILFQLGDLLLHATPRGEDSSRASGQALPAHMQDAVRFLRASLQADPKRAATEADLGYFEELQRSDAEADRHYAAAVELGGNDYLPYLLAGEHQMRRMFAMSKERGGLFDADLKTARNLFARAVQLNPASARAYAGLGATYLNERNVVPGIAALEKSWAMSPTDYNVAVELALLYARHGDRERAVDLIERVVSKSDDPQMLKMARENLLLADLQRADDLRLAGKRDEALALIRSVRDQTSDADLKRRLDEQLRKVDAQNARNLEIARYNEAVSKANAREIKAACALLDKLIAEGKEADIVEAAKKLRNDLAPEGKRGKR